METQLDQSSFDSIDVIADIFGILRADYSTPGIKATYYRGIVLDKRRHDGYDWDFYAGPGVMAGYGTGVNKNDEKVAAPFLGAAAQLGLEYTFWFPLQLSVDFRPTFMVPTLMNRTTWYGFAVSARYAF